MNIIDPRWRCVKVKVVFTWRLVRVWIRKNINYTFVTISFQQVWYSERIFLYHNWVSASNNLGFHIFMQLFLLPILSHCPSTVKRLIIGKWIWFGLETKLSWFWSKCLDDILNNLWNYLLKWNTCVYTCKHTYIYTYTYWILLLCEF